MSTPRENSDTPPNFEIGPKTTAKLPVVWWWSITVALVLFGAGLITMRDAVARMQVDVIDLRKTKVDVSSLESVKVDVADLKKEAKAANEMLFRIDENVKDLKALRRP